MRITELNLQDNDEKNRVWGFLNQFDYIPFQQFPEYSFLEDLPVRGWIASEGEKIIGWVEVTEKRRILALIQFGPVSVNDEAILALLEYVVNHYKNHLFWLVQWMPYCYSQEIFERVSSKIQGRVSLIQPKGEIHWSSKRISIMEPGGNILKKFSENHRRSIRKATAADIKCTIIEDIFEVKRFTDGYIRMYCHRKLHVDAGKTKQSFLRLYQYLKNTKKGFFLGAFKGTELLGGVIIIYQGKSAFYYKGYMDHEKRQLPVNHISFYNAILQAQKDKMLWFDFGGYALNTNEKQVMNINRFKDGFKGELISFPGTSIIGLRKFWRAVYHGIRFKRKLWNRLKVII